MNHEDRALTNTVLTADGPFERDAPRRGDCGAGGELPKFGVLRLIDSPASASGMPAPAYTRVRNAPGYLAHSQDDDPI